MRMLKSSSCNIASRAESSGRGVGTDNKAAVGGDGLSSYRGRTRRDWDRDEERATERLPEGIVLRRVEDDRVRG